MFTLTRAQIVLLVSILIVLVGVGWYTWTVYERNRAANQPASAARAALQTTPGSAYTDLDGNPIYLDDYLGGALVVNSWASWCPLCASELKTIAKVAKEYQEQPVAFLAINRAEPGQRAQRFLDVMGVSRDILLVLDPTDRYYDHIGGYTMPETIFYDRAGNIVHHQRGELTEKQVVGYLEAALKVPQE